MIIQAVGSGVIAVLCSVVLIYVQTRMWHAERMRLGMTRRRLVLHWLNTH